jgi:cell division protein FtsB
MNLTSIPLPLIIFAITQTVAAIWFIAKLYSSVEAMKEKVNQIEKENRELKQQLKELSDTLLLVKHSVDLLVIGRLKTGNMRDVA